MSQISLTKTRFGLAQVLTHDEYVGKALMKYGDYSYDEVKLFQQFAQPGSMVMDVGSNHGYFAFALADSVGPEGLVVAVEPQRLLASMILAGTVLQDRFNIAVLNMAVGADPGEITLAMPNYQTDANYGALSLETMYRNGEGFKTQLNTIDNIIASTGREPSFIKIDVEGMEIEALKGATTTLSTTKPWLYVESDRPEYNQEVLKFLEAFDYSMYWAIVPLYSPDNYNKVSENIYGNRVSINFLCAPPGCTVEGTAQRVTSDNPEFPIPIVHA
jgi:FkbM family methyltransferase